MVSVTALFLSNPHDGRVDRICLRRRDLAVRVPKVFPRLAVFPEKDLAFDETAVAIDCGDGAHVVRGERIADDGAEIGGDVIRIHRKRDGRLAALDGPLETHG